jgi:anti-sigma28 factor (negative regulator of flagellin synthesis)
VDNENGYAESYREVIHEDKIKIGGATKAPDYSFRLPGGKRLFFLEAKKPSVEIKEDTQPAYQIRRYGWSAKMPISVITDFEELAIYDCTNKPKPTDKASNGRIKYITYDNYKKEFDFIWDTFSKERVLKGSFDKYISSDKNKKGTTTVDHDFLASLDKWRIEIAKNIALRNKILDEDLLNFVIQSTLDRIIFLRIAEDRGAEQYGNLQSDIKQGDYYKNLLNRFDIADQKYNSGLFDFRKDIISKHIAIDNKVIKNIISELYYPVCPYEFSVLSVEILGSAYEQFLGKRILLSKSGRATIEEKPEVRKAGGVYYTPQYIVDYIVKNTVGKLIENKTPKEVSEIKIVDPACGSGSFLIGAYQYLLNWHKDLYTQNGKQSKGHKDNPLTPTGELTTAEKKRILLNNIFGVDLDSNAVEVTKLSLLLKCMEGETKETIEAQTKIFHDRILPTLDNNIKSGNSLIDLDYYNSVLDFGEERKIKPFSWQKSFPEVFAQGGFDCVIGNPPYGADLGSEIKHYLSLKYELPIPIADSYLMFIKRAISISKFKGLISYIIPSTWLYMPQFKEFRKLLISEKTLFEIQLFRKSVFADATVETCTIILENSKPKEDTTYYFKEIKDEPSLFCGEIFIQKQLNLLNTKEYKLIVINKKEEELFEKIRENTPLINIALTVCGLTPYRVGKGIPPQTEKIAKNREYDSDYKKDETYRQYLMGRDFNKYQWCIEKERWISYGKWLAEPRYKAPFEDIKKIVIRQTSDKLIAHLDTNKYLSLKNVHNLRITNTELTYEYLLALINSKLMDWWYQRLIPEKGRVFAEVKVVNLEKLPIKVIDKENKVEIQRESEIVKHVNQLLQLNKELKTTILPEKVEQLKQRIEYSEDKINEIVYELYGLTEEEVKIIMEK